MKTRNRIIVIGVMIILSIGIFSIVDTEYVSLYKVSTGSMRPALDVNDMVWLDKKVPFDDLQVGDIIVFERPEGESRVIISRIIDVNYDGIQRTITTQGDANPSSIPGTNFPITKDNFIGKVIGR